MQFSNVRYSFVKCTADVFCVRYVEKKNITLTRRVGIVWLKRDTYVEYNFWVVSVYFNLRS